MLDSFIIEELERREERERNRARHQQPTLDLPVDDVVPPRPTPRQDDEEKSRKRGVVIIEI
jgi:hypothetical protein